MTIHNVIPMLTTAQAQETIDFYTNMLGFTCNKYDHNTGWALLQYGNAEIMLSAPNTHIPFEKPQFTGSFYFTTDMVDELWNKFKDKAKVCYPVENFHYGMREFAIYDNNGYLLQFGQNINAY